MMMTDDERGPHIDMRLEACMHQLGHLRTAHAEEVGLRQTAIGKAFSIEQQLEGALRKVSDNSL